ncbi:Retrovirus-related Pol polyprotein from transposon [Sesamum angolense]|uniref:Retrovirus-related Pol polyprotein from transposon n=1 Tax=Sesamum angolense TaxID=2727404 RepID=A0AAE1X9M1_9LAMI|nr:Retrovirus-related Pol polyprotein from transposon [Sesamum angolense]
MLCRNHQEWKQKRDERFSRNRKWGKDPVPSLDPDNETPATVQPVEEPLTIKFTPSNPGEITKIGSKIIEDVRDQVVQCLWRNKDFFAWTPQDMEGINPGVIAHHLNLDPSVKPVMQKRRYKRLLSARHIKEIQFPELLSNIPLVPKLGGKWRMCIDFQDLNKACPKDFYPLPRIDQLVHSTSGCELLSMMETPQGYHQIMLAPEDHKKVSFITSDDTFCYVAVPFGLKNAGATYQRLVDKIF